MKRNTKIALLIAFLIMLLFFVLDVLFGSVKISFGEFINWILNHEMKSTNRYILENYRIPKAISAMLSGMGLAITGLLLQTYFKNPMADSYILGMSSGASAGVATLILGSAFLPSAIIAIFQGSYAITFAAIIGSVLTMNLILAFSRKFSDVNSILILGIMVSSLVSAVITVLISMSSAENLQRFTFWSMGSLGQLSWDKLNIFAVILVVSIAYSLRLMKPLHAMYLGEQYAQSLGINYKRFQFQLVIISSLICGTITAFVGPIAFIGLAVPHIARILFKTQDHYVLWFANLWIGATLMLICDLLSQILISNMIFPINAITSLIGAPMVIYLLWKNKNRF